ncbi:sigma-54 dependent transcriptional regulator [bacterium]|nr:sigma-54 dependent transcriptional regulator [bacterium]
MATLLIADDEASIRTILTKALEKDGHEILRAKTGQEALVYLQSRPIDLALVDIRMPEITGLDLLKQTDKFLGKPYIIIITAQDTMENAIEAMKRGAYDYITKPFDIDELSILVNRALETRNLKTEVTRLKAQEIKESKTSPTIVGKTREIQEIYKTIGKVANQDVAVLIEGESGTGKELIARAIHYQGSRVAMPFVAVNCAAIPANLLESELFGAKKGAFTGANEDKQGYFLQANKGTLFLDEIGDMPMDLQAKLLRVLQQKEVQRLGDSKVIPIDVRIISATNANLTKKVKDGKFREDLYFRLNVVPIFVPPLRERKKDIPYLSQYFLDKACQEFGLPEKEFAEDALDYLTDNPWPGNIRELENLIKRVSVLTQRPIIEAADFKKLSKGLDLGTMPGNYDAEQLEAFIESHIQLYLKKVNVARERDVYNKFVGMMERPLIRQMLIKKDGNQIKAAEILGINRNTLRKKIRELKIDLRDLLKENEE